jgi:hypothetical protein
MGFNEGDTLNDYCCLNEESCHIHKMPRYSRTDADGILAIERIVLTDDIYILIEHLQNRTTISKLDIIVIDDHVVIHRALKLNLKDYERTISKIKTYILFS